VPPLPPFPFLSRILLRAAIVWIGFRGTLFLLFGLVVPTAIAAAAIIGITAVVVFLDLRRRTELVFLGNIGTGSAVIAVCATIMPLTGEIVVRLLQ